MNDVTIEYLIESFKDISKDYPLTFSLPFSLAENKIKVHVDYLSIPLNLDKINMDYKSISHYYVSKLEERFTNAFSSAYEVGNMYLDVNVPNVVETEHLDYDMDDEPCCITSYENYELFEVHVTERFSSDKARDNFLVEEFPSQFSSGKGKVKGRRNSFNIIDGYFKIESGKVWMVIESDDVSLTPIQRSYDFTNFLNSIITEEESKIVYTNPEENDNGISHLCRAMCEAMNVWHESELKNVRALDPFFIESGDVRYNFSFRNSKGKSGHFQGVICSTRHKFVDYNKLNRFKYNMPVSSIPVYHDIIHDDAEFNSTFGYEYKPSLWKHTLRDMNDARTPATDIILYYFGSLVENRFDSQSRGSFVLSADDLKVYKVYFMNSTYYGFNEKNELIAELILNPDDFDQSIKNNDVMEAMNNFFMDIVKAKEQLEDEEYEKRKEIRKKLKEILN